MSWWCVGGVFSLALSVQIYLKIDRLDLAGKTVKAMQDLDDDDALTTLATVWLYIAMGGDKTQEAYHLLEELIEKFQHTTTLLNTMAVCSIAQKNFAAAFASLRQARELAIQNKEKISAETLINSLVCLQQMHKAPELTVRILAYVHICCAHPLTHSLPHSPTDCLFAVPLVI